jgi:hypothetical protein
MSLEGTLLVSEYKANKNKNKNKKNDNNNDTRHYHFAICKACFWTATLLGIKPISNNGRSISCPVCFDHQQISLIPLIVR